MARRVHEISQGGASETRIQIFWRLLSAVEKCTARCLKKREPKIDLDYLLPPTWIASLGL